METNSIRLRARWNYSQGQAELQSASGLQTYDSKLFRLEPASCGTTASFTLVHILYQKS